MAWTDEQINSVLAELGLRTPGGEPVKQPERIVAAALLDARQRIQDLVREVLEANTKRDRALTELDTLRPIVKERDDLVIRVRDLTAAVDTARKAETLAKAERDAAFKMVRDLELKVRELQAQIDGKTPLPPAKPPVKT